MPQTQERKRSKSSRRIQMKSPLAIKHKISYEDSSKQKISMGKSHTSTNDSIEFDRRAFGNIRPSHPSDGNRGKNFVSTESFKNKILVNSCEFNRLKEKLKSGSGTPKGQSIAQNQKKKQKKVKVRIIDRLTKRSSNSSDNNQTNNTTGSSDSEQVELLKIQNEYFKKIYDQALDQLSKLRNKLKEEKKVHDVEKQIYQTQLNKLKRIVDSEKEQVSHIIYDDENSCVIVVSAIRPEADEGFLGIDSDCESEVGNISIQSK